MPISTTTSKDQVENSSSSSGSGFSFMRLFRTLVCCSQAQSRAAFTDVATANGNAHSTHAPSKRDSTNKKKASFLSKRHASKPQAASASAGAAASSSTSAHANGKESPGVFPSKPSAEAIRRRNQRSKSRPIRAARDGPSVYVGESKEECNCEEWNLQPMGTPHEKDVTSDTVDLWGPHLYGARKFLGGAPSKDGRYCFGVPSHTDYVIRLDTVTGEVTKLAEGLLPQGQFKWLRGILAPSGAIYCIPACAPCVLKIIPETSEVKLFGHEACIYGGWQWHGAALSKTDGNIYAIPANAKRVLRIEPETDTVSLHGPELDEGGVSAKWYGGIKGRDGSIWGVPYNATCCLKIKPASAPGLDDVEVKCIGSFPRGGYKWHGGTSDCLTGAIWGIPSHARGVLKILPEEERAEIIENDDVFSWEKDPETDDWVNSRDTRYKFGGAVADSSGTVWCIPSDVDFVLKVKPGIDGKPDRLFRIGKVDHYKNKYQGGVLVPGGGDNGGDAVFCIPCDATDVLKINCETDRLEAIGYLPGNLKKFQGAYYAPDGTIWGLPESARHILRIRPHASSREAGTFEFIKK
ncbi:hypothetical protein NFJ02_20g43720 [Pycnococcus provasolii]